MSKLAKALAWDPQRERVALLEPLRYSDVRRELEPVSMCNAYRMRLAVTFEARAVVDEKGGPEGLTYVEARLRRAVLEEVFGEFRRGLIDAAAYLADRDYEAARKEIEGVLKEMFNP